MLESFLPVFAGAVATYAYFALFNKTIDLSRRLSRETAQGVILLSYFVRLTVVAAILGGSVLIFKADVFLTAVAFLVINTTALLFNGRRLVKALVGGQSPAGKD